MSGRGLVPLARPGNQMQRRLSQGLPLLSGRTKPALVINYLFHILSIFAKPWLDFKDDCGAFITACFGLFWLVVSLDKVPQQTGHKTHLTRKI